MIILVIFEEEDMSFLLPYANLTKNNVSVVVTENAT